MEDFNSPPLPPKEVPSLLDPLKPVIDKWLEGDLRAPRKQRHTAKRVYERLLNEYPDQLEVKLRTVQYYGVKCQSVNLLTYTICHQQSTYVETVVLVVKN